MCRTGSGHSDGPCRRGWGRSEIRDSCRFTDDRIGVNESADFAALAVPVSQFGPSREPQRLVVMGAMPFPHPIPLLPGAGGFGWDWMQNWHRSPNNLPPRDIACYLIRDLELSRWDHLFYQGRPLATLEFLPQFLLSMLPQDQAQDAAARAARPTRVIEEPCFVLGTNGRTYGHFLIETMARAYVMQSLLRPALPPFRILVERTVSPWALGMLHDAFGVTQERIIFYDANAENILLREALFPTLAITSDHLHPINNLMVGDLIGALGGGGLELPRLFVSRLLIDRRAGRGGCENEAQLAAVAAHEYGFAVVAPETLPWKEQIRMFANAKVVLGEFGSGMHNTLFGQRGQRVGVIHLENMVQSSISSLRQQNMAYLRVDRETNGTFLLNLDHFRRFLDVLVANA